MLNEIEYLTIHITANEGRVWAYRPTVRFHICEQFLEKGLLELEYDDKTGKMYNVTELGFEKIEEYQKANLGFEK